MNSLGASLFISISLVNNKMEQRLDLLIFGAHPDDAEIGMAGTIKKHTSAGLRVGVCDLTRAEMSSNGTVEIRQSEADRASEILGLAMRSNLGLPDRGLFLQSDYIMKITAEIRKWKPRIVCAPYWQDRHPDHVSCSMLVQEAVFNAKLRQYMPESSAHTVENTWFYFINDVADVDVMVDVSSYYDAKRDALYAYASQFNFSQASSEQVLTPLNQGYVERVEARDLLLGQKRNVQYAEGFVSKLPILMDRIV